MVLTGREDVRALSFIGFLCLRPHSGANLCASIGDYFISANAAARLTYINGYLNADNLC